MTQIAPNHDYQLVETIQAAGADLDLDNGVLSFGNPLARICRYVEISDSEVVAAVTAVPAKTTITFTAVANTTYELLLQQYNPSTGNFITKTFNYTTAASGDDATSIGDAFRARINAATNAGALFIAATGSTTLILDGTAVYPIFTTTALQAASSTAIVLTTPGVMPVNTTASLAIEGITAAASSEYTRVTIWYAPMSGQNVQNPIGAKQRLDLYLNEAATNFSDLSAKFTYILDGREVSAGGPANPEAISVA